MKTREEALKFGLSFKNVYEERPFKDQNWQLVRVKGSKKAFLWIYERDGYINLNVKVNPEWRDFWRSAYDAVIAGYHKNKEYWNTIILDGSIPDKDIKRMIAESYDIITDSPTKRIYEAVKRIPKGYAPGPDFCAGHFQLLLTSSHCLPSLPLFRTLPHVPAQKSGPGAYPVFSRSKCEGRTGRSLCIWWRKDTGEAS